MTMLLLLVRVCRSPAILLVRRALAVNAWRALAVRTWIAYVR